MASVSEKQWKGFQSYINDMGGAQNGEGENSNDSWQKSGDDDEWERWDTKDDGNDNGKMDNGWDDAGWNSTEWDTSKSKSKPKASNSFSKKKDTSSNGWDNVDMDQWDSEDWTSSKQRTKGD